MDHRPASPDRRAFLLGAAGVAGAAAAMTTPLPARASGGSSSGGRAMDRALRRRAERALRRRDRVAARTLARLGAEQPDALQQDYARATGAMAALSGLSRVPLRHQAHPTVQATIAALAGDVGRGLLAVRDLLARVAEAEKEPGEDELAAALDRTAAGLVDEEEVLEGSRVLHRNGLAALREELADEGLRLRSRRELRRLDRLVSLSERIAEAGGDTDVLAPPDPRVLAALEEGASLWGTEPPGLAAGGRAEAGFSGPDDDYVTGTGRRGGALTAVQVLGIIACGLGILVGGFLGVVSLACAVACEAPGLVVLTILGGLLVVGCILGIRAILRA